ncbi:MAG: PEP-CTERM sorting domain-containing protein [Planctomycetes bacterium]|nr:PEP-CTERM sorting domain-containing protein [Planctomycetota bacterium]
MLKRKKKTGNSIARRNRIALGTLCLIGSAAFAGTANAGLVLYSQLPDQANGWFADSSGSNANFRHADSFSLGSAATIGQIEFWGAYLPANMAVPDNFTINIFADDLGLPGNALLTTSLSNLTRTDTGVDFFGFDEYMYTAELTTFFAADAGTTYWFSITNDTGLGPDGTWFWETGFGADGLNAQSSDFGASWHNNQGDLAFVLKTPVPAPGALALLGISGLVCGRSRRRKKN